ncbi:12460_t:CDS:2 [Ambispora leptoticha]|uniref:12460_t:CDS:1 n=1 Tax=Ambispora leptoticha TaxID=144679 RepID=A0A9N9FVQ4_9GLOM|nr:12460_t:CDS:2 [Ambispora leptoticha]
MDVTGKIVFHSLLRRKDVWFLDVSDLDAMDPDAVFQYVAHRSPPQADLVLTRVPELRHLVYVKHDEEGRPYPIKMRNVVKTPTKKKQMSGKLQEEIIQEEVMNEENTTTEEHFQPINAQKAPENTTVVTKSRSFWDLFPISLIKTTSQSAPSAASSTS